MRVINLKKNNFYLDQYVKLRNKNRKLLLSGAVNQVGTRKWLVEKKIEIFGIVLDDILEGVVILYKEKNGEIAFFVRTPGKGIGTMLLKNILRVAKSKNIQYVWAWVLKRNKIAQHVFKKLGFQDFKETVRIFEMKRKSGIMFRKLL